MGRLTRRVEEDGIKAIYINEKSEEDFECFLENEYGYKTADKLAAYEDIIDEPEKLLIVDKFLLEKCEEINELYKELAEYKKLEEGGLLLRLPCKVGDTVYYVDDLRKMVDECKVTRLECRTMNRYHMGISIEMEGKLRRFVRNEWIGRVVYFTKEEAEQELERMKEVQDK